jgi:hypothetical protein
VSGSRDNKTAYRIIVQNEKVKKPTAKFESERILLK